MIKLSVLCITYQRYRLLEECIQSYLEQDFQGPSEMVVVNDSPLVKYDMIGSIGGISSWAGTRGWTKHIRIINAETRFPNIGRKLEYGFKQCQGDWVVRLDDDDLLMPNALTQIQSFITQKPDVDVVRFSNFYLMGNNTFERMSEGINTLNTLSRSYINRLEWPDENATEDLKIIFGEHTTQYTAPNTAGMIYRWRGDGTNISCHVDKPNEERLNFMPTTESGSIILNPHFDHNYYDRIYNSLISSIHHDQGTACDSR